METKGTDWNESNHQSWVIGTYDGHDDACYVWVERSARLEQGGYDQVSWLTVNGASASGTQ